MARAAECGTLKLITSRGSSASLGRPITTLPDHWPGEGSRLGGLGQSFYLCVSDYLAALEGVFP